MVHFEFNEVFQKYLHNSELMNYENFVEKRKAFLHQLIIKDIICPMYKPYNVAVLNACNGIKPMYTEWHGSKYMIVYFEESGFLFLNMGKRSMDALKYYIIPDLLSAYEKHQEARYMDIIDVTKSDKSIKEWVSKVFELIEINYGKQKWETTEEYSDAIGCFITFDEWINRKIEIKAERVLI